MAINLDNLLRVPILRNVAGTSERGIGIKIGWLALSRISKYDDRWGIFVLDTGKLLVKCRFTNFETAYQIAERIEEVYREYWIIIGREGYPDLSLAELCAWTIPNGHKWADEIKALETMDIVPWTDPTKFIDTMKG